MKSSHTAFTSWWVLLAAAGGMMIGKTPFASASLNIRNVALGKQANQTSTYIGSTYIGDHPGPAEFAVDGNTNGMYIGESVTATSFHNPGELPDDTIFWKVDLDGYYVISEIKVYNRKRWAERLRGFYVEIRNDNYAVDADGDIVWTTKTTPMVDKGLDPVNIILNPLGLCETDCNFDDHCAEGLRCQHQERETISQCSGVHLVPDFRDLWVKLDVDASDRVLSLAEVEVYGTSIATPN